MRERCLMGDEAGGSAGSCGHDGGRSAALQEILVDARRAGFLGPGPIGRHIHHGQGFARAAAEPGGERDGRQGGERGKPCNSAGAGQVLDLGSGGGVPGLVLALEWPGVRLTLLDANERRVTFLRRATATLRLQPRVEVLLGRAEAVGRDEARRGRYSLVVARSFGPPAVTAECSAPFLAVGGRLVVSEPPDGPENRWPADGLSVLGMGPARPVRGAYAYQVIYQERACPDRFPRRVGVPAKRPIF